MRAQASLEFLVTYGWAIALTIVTLSWIAYMGFADPTDLAGESCRVSGEFGCEEAKLSAGLNSASFVLRNLQLNKVSVQAVNISYDSEESGCSIKDLNGADLAFVRSGEEFEALCSDLSFPAGEKVLVDFTINYNSSVGFTKESKGEIVGLVQEG